MTRERRCVPAGSEDGAALRHHGSRASRRMSPRRRRVRTHTWHSCGYGLPHCRDVTMTFANGIRSGFAVLRLLAMSGRRTGPTVAADGPAWLRHLAMPLVRAVQARSRSGIRTHYLEIWSRALPDELFDERGPTPGEPGVAERTRGTAERPRARRRTASVGMQWIDHGRETSCGGRERVTRKRERPRSGAPGEAVVSPSVGSADTGQPGRKGEDITITERCSRALGGQPLCV